MVNIQWYPGHMEKARREMSEKMKVVDMVIECRDARIPLASKNPLIDQLVGQKPRLILLTKTDLADPMKTKEWISYFNQENQKAITVNLKKGQGFQKEIIVACLELNRKRRDKQRSRGIEPRAIRAMVCGIPNVGKSTLINRISGKNRLEAANRPGITRSLTWLHADRELDLLDTPGVLWPKFEDQKVASLLAVLGSINEDILDPKFIAMDAIRSIQEGYPHFFTQAYAIQEDMNPNQVLKAIAEKRGFKLEGDVLDTKRAAQSFIYDLRKAKFGGISLESVHEGM
ncbi:ribosome biogenesis GTPase YlqF [Bulleidia sp. zg-1006]|uniref:ribosome biogenesis GTPase YlqF n=1 Tax=Bulleidia sp. zg-1006 TaxID=2806552 RepID=UPI001939A14B|nr:ribosome biogenesis GTPase YlqF [Bulleidia sp. zg-1006]QRG87136.1 ribosome biogenesis GTPase YlqF [Bulleidia sp. zg-1006]